MAKKISQEYFDSIVNENVNDFGMAEEEAIEDAIQQRQVKILSWLPSFA